MASETSSTAAPDTARTLVDLADPAGDQGSDGPPYADAVRLRLDTKGDQLIAALIMGAALPTKLSSSEVMGIGIDFYRAGATESDYELFADGEPDGWYAYVDTPDGFVRYPGTFNLAESQVSFTIPWAAFGGLQTGEVSAFVDWSRSQTVTSLASADHVPDSGRVSFTR